MKISTIKIKNLLVLAAVIVMVASSWSGQALAAPRAIFTANFDCTQVNGNIYDTKDDVYLNGGPKGNLTGLAAGNYYVQVTAPGKPGENENLLGKSVSAPVLVNANGTVAQCYQLSAILFKASDSTPGYDDTTNNGGEYKVWLSQDPNFANSNSKTDNFKVKPKGCGNECSPPPPTQVTISGYKFYDYNQNKMFDDDEQAIPGWKMTLSQGNDEKGMTETDLDGKYEFIVDIGTDNYVIKEELRSADNWKAITVDMDGNAQKTVGSAADTTDVNFGNIRQAKVGGLKFRDSNMNGVQDMGEGVISDIEIKIATVEPTGDQNVPVIETVETEMDGSWTSGLHPLGTKYYICENVDTDAFLQTAPVGGCHSLTPAVTLDLNAIVDVSGLNFGNIGLTSIGGTKYKDANMDGNGAGDLGISGVTIDVTYTRPNNSTGMASTTSGTGGAWSISHIPEGSTFEACEVVPTGSIPTAATCRMGIAGDDSAVDFFNIPVFRIGGVKYYDSDLNGVFSSGDTTLGGIKITVTATLPNNTSDVDNTIVTGAGGVWTSKLYPEGTTYIVTETLPSASIPPALVTSWTQVNSRGTTGTVSSSSASADFLNVCSATPGGHTLGFWSNKNGQALIKAEDFTRLNGYSLRNANGTDKDFNELTLDNKKKALNSWILSANATNMAYMLSAQMTATDLSVRSNFTNSSVIVDGMRTVAQEIAYANSTLLADTYDGVSDSKSITIASSAARTEQGRVKDIFDKINNNGSFKQPVACSVNY